MELNQPLDSEIYAMDIEPDSKADLLGAAKWARFISIVGFIFLVLFVFVFLIAGGTIHSFGENEFGAFTVGKGLGAFLFLVIMGSLIFFPNYYLYNFSSRIITAINSSSTIDLTDGLKNLKSVFKFYGITFALSLGIFAIAFLLGGIVSIF